MKCYQSSNTFDLWSSIFDFFVQVSLLMPNRVAVGVKAILNTEISRWQRESFIDEVDLTITKPYIKSQNSGLMVYPSEALDPKTKRYWSLLFVVCSCGFGEPHAPTNGIQCSPTQRALEKAAVSTCSTSSVALRQHTNAYRTWTWYGKSSSANLLGNRTTHEARITRLSCIGAQVDGH